ncbi:MAG: WYL domain-containing protein [Spirochaetaceae bacterium]|nr:WYL domain-containing protein [Spirochaetaceae bacterium]
MGGKKQREDKVKNLRLLQIDELIREGKCPNATFLKNYFEVSRATIARDIEFLRSRYNAPIKTKDTAQGGYYYENPSFSIKTIMLTEGELFTISAILPLLEQYKNTPLEESMKSVFSKILEFLPSTQVSVESAFINKDVKFIPDPLPKINQEIFYKVFDATKQRVDIQFEYRSIKKTDFEKRVASPYRIICQKGSWYMLCLCHKNNEMRVFSLSRVQNIELLPTKFEIPKDFDIRKYIDPYFGIWANNEKPEKIELVFSKDVNTLILERTWHKNQITKQQPDGSVYLSFETNQKQEILHWIQSFGKNVKVLAPADLAAEIKAEALSVAAMY